MADKKEQSRIGRSNVRRSKTHERSIAHWLTEWSGREFRRRRVEGRDTTTIERESTSDVIAVRDEIHCSIEAKCGAVASFAALLENPLSTKFTEWWHQVCYDTNLVSNIFHRAFYPMMFFRPYPNQNWVALSEHLFSNRILRSKNDLESSDPWFPHLYFDGYNRTGPISFNVVRTKNKENYKFVGLELPAIVMCRWKDFADNVDPDSFFYKG